MSVSSLVAAYRLLLNASRLLHPLLPGGFTWLGCWLPKARLSFHAPSQARPLAQDTHHHVLDLAPARCLVHTGLLRETLCTCLSKVLVRLLLAMPLSSWVLGSPLPGCFFSWVLGSQSLAVFTFFMAVWRVVSSNLLWSTSWT